MISYNVGDFAESECRLLDYTEGIPSVILMSGICLRFAEKQTQN